MGQITDEQRQLEVAAQSLAAKLQTFEEGLTGDERRMFGLAVGAVAAAKAGEDVAGHVWRDWREPGWVDGVGEVRNWCLTWQGWRPGQPLPRPEPLT